MKVPSFIIYCGIGGINTGVSISVMAAVGWLGAPYFVYTAMGYVVAMAVSYLLNSRFTFGRQSPNLFAAGKFFGFNMGILLLTEALTALAIEIAGISELIAVAGGLVFYTMTGFLINKHYVFVSPDCTRADSATREVNPNLGIRK